MPKTTSAPKAKTWECTPDEPWWAMLLRRSNAKTEADTTFDGFLSHATEFHAVGIGFTVGFTAYSTIPEDIKWIIATVLGIEQTGIKKGVENNKAFREIREEPWYFFLGLFAGLALGAVHRFGITGVIEAAL